MTSTPSPRPHAGASPGPILHILVFGAVLTALGPWTYFGRGVPLTARLFGGAIGGLVFSVRMARVGRRKSGIQSSYAIWNGTLATFVGAVVTRAAVDGGHLALEIAYRLIYFRSDALAWIPRLAWLGGNLPGHLLSALPGVAIGLVLGPLSWAIQRRMSGIRDRRVTLLARTVTVVTATCGVGLVVTGLEQERALRSRWDDQVEIPAGPFIMGADGWLPDEGPAHTARVDSFVIDRHEITIGRYWAFLHATGREHPPGWDDPARPFTLRPHHPVEAITWQEAAAYARHVGRRLPTEAEWERAARGTDGRAYPWGDTYSEENLSTGRVPCKMDNPGRIDPRRPGERTGCYGHPANRSRPVGSTPGDRSPDGVMDMAGNVAEWVSDLYDPRAYSSGHDPAPGTTDRVYRGGDYGGPSETKARLTRRHHGPEDERLWGKGFRTVAVR